MRRFSFIPKAELMSEELQYTKKPFGKKESLLIFGLFIVAVFAMMSILLLTGHYGVIFFMLGLISLSIGIYSFKLQSRLGDLLSIAVGVLMFYWTIELEFGDKEPVFFRNIAVITIVIIAVFLMIIPLVRRIFLVKRAERCTVDVKAMLNDGQKDIDFSEELPVPTAYVNKDGETVIKNIGIGTKGYEYIYSYNGNRYIVRMAPSRRDKMYSQHGRQLKMKIVPDEPENYFHTGVLGYIPLGSFIFREIVCAAVVAFLIWKCCI